MRLDILCLVLFLFSCNSTVSISSPEVGLRLNEVMVSNCKESGIIAPNGSYEDWIELYNMGDSTIFLGDYFISDSLANPTKKALPPILLEPKEYITFWGGTCKKNDDFFLGFSFSNNEKNRESVFLTHRNKGIIDSCNYRAYTGSLKKGTSLGRVPDGATLWQKQTYPSPSGANNG